MHLPSVVLATRDRYVTAFPMWSMPAGEDADARAREWTLGLIAQVCYEHPGQGYGSKRADPGRPLSKDAMAQIQQPATATTLTASSTKAQKAAVASASMETMIGWDMLTGAGSGTPTVNQNPDSMDMTGQVFEPVMGADVIGGAPIPGPPPSGGSTIEVIPYTEAYAVEFGQACNAVYVESGATFDPGMISVHSQRAAWDYYVGQMPWAESCAKHVNEFRAEYGLPPV